MGGGGLRGEGESETKPRGAPPPAHKELSRPDCLSIRPRQIRRPYASKPLGKRPGRFAHVNANTNEL